MKAVQEINPGVLYDFLRPIPITQFVMGKLQQQHLVLIPQLPKPIVKAVVVEEGTNVLFARVAGDKLQLQLVFEWRVGIGRDGHRSCSR